MNQMKMKKITKIVIANTAPNPTLGEDNALMSRRTSVWGVAMTTCPRRARLNTS